MVGFILACLGHRYRAVAGSNPALPTNQAINLMAQQFEECIMEPELRPEFIESLKASETEKTIKVKDFDSRYSE
jgi:hypothetical protein